MKTLPLKLPLCFEWLKRVLHRAPTPATIEMRKDQPKRPRRHITTTFFEMP